MPQQISIIMTGSGTINAVANHPEQGHKAYTIPKDHKNYDAIKEAIKNDDPVALDRLADLPKTVQDFSQGKVTVKDGVVFYMGKSVHNALTQRILDLIREGFPFAPMLKFFENLMNNSSFRAVNELYPFLEHRGLPITEDGCFLGYKAVKADYTDKRSGTFSNKVGSVHEIPRNTVDDNWRLDCSNGFHVGSLEYVKDFSKLDDDHIMIVKVNPADVVSVPANEVTKLRTCKYEVVGEYDRNKLMEGVHLQGSVYTAEGTPATPKSSGMGGYGYTPDEEDEDEDFDSELEEEEFEDDDDDDLDDDDDDLDDDDDDDQ